MTAPPLLIVFLFGILFALLDASWLASSAHTLLRLVAPSPKSSQIAKVKKDLIDAKKSLAAISAQDEFARWAKERRRSDKLEKEFADLVKAQGSEKSAFESSVSWAVWGLVWFLHISIILMYRTTPMFYVPASFVGPFARMLRMPFAPIGSVSVVFWLFATKNVVKKMVASSKLVVNSVSGSAVEKKESPKTVKVE
ncbi:GET complex subunit get1 [Podochytrium sp. JEL0797]|nr:GET complex subunit get1 [Podochytrium sp. JEL0797]